MPVGPSPGHERVDLAWEAWTDHPHSQPPDAGAAAHALNRSWHTLRATLRRGADPEHLAQRYTDLEAAARTMLPLAHPDTLRALTAVRDRAGERAAELRRLAAPDAATRRVAHARTGRERPLAQAGAEVRASLAHLNAAYHAWRAGDDFVPTNGEVAVTALDEAWAAARERVTIELEAGGDGPEGVDGATIADRTEEPGETCLTLAHHARTLTALPQSPATRAHLHEIRVHAERTARAQRALAHPTNPPPVQPDAPSPTRPARPARPQLTAHTLGPALSRTVLDHIPAPNLASDPNTERLRNTYRADLPLMRAVWHRTWWTRATPTEVAHTWAATSRWAARGSTYAAATLRHLRGRIRQHTGLEPPPPTHPPGPDLSATLTIGLIHPPHGDTVWWQCTAHDPTAATRLLTETREPATAWERPEDVAARVHADLEHVHRLRADVLRRVRITTTREDDATNRHLPNQSRIRGTDIARIRQKATLRHDQEQHTTRLATLLRRDLDTTWRSTATHTEINAIRREVNTWPSGPTRTDTLAFLQRQTWERFGANSTSTRHPKIQPPW
ncbi:hypothetical protein [Embleya sp. NPDC001921]